VLKGLHCCDSFVWVVLKEFGEEVKASGRFTVVVAIPFAEVVGILFKGGEVGVFRMEVETRPFVA
jgi:hypothetical protein